MQVGVLGRLLVRVGGAPVTIRGAKPASLLALLALQANRVVRAEALIEDLWSGSQPIDARNTLQVHISKLRRELGAEEGRQRLTSVADGYRLELHEDELDSATFERLARPAARESADAAIRRLRRALDLWRGEVLEDFTDSEWRLRYAPRLEELRLQLLEDLMAEQLLNGDAPQVVAVLEPMVASEPLRERLWGQLMLALHRCQRSADALRTFSRLASHLDTELGIVPSSEIADLEQRILTQDVHLEWSAGRSSAAAFDQPSYRRGSPVRESVVRSPPARSHAPADAWPTLAPLDQVPLVGRQVELEGLTSLLEMVASGGRAIAVITGEPGIGKTRLVRELAARAERLGMGVLAAECAPSSLPQPYLPLVEALQEPVESAVDPSVLRQRLGAAAEYLTVLFPVLGMPRSPGEQSGADATRSLFEAAVVLLSWLTERQPRVLVLEDVQWIDQATADLLDFIGRRRSPTGLLVLLSSRTVANAPQSPGRSLVETWTRSERTGRIDLAPLSRGEVEQLAALLLASAEIGEEFGAWVTEWSGGNPLAVAELLSDAVERGDVFSTTDDEADGPTGKRGEGDVGRGARPNGDRTGAGRRWERLPLAELHVPPSLEATILERAGRLGDDLVAVLESMSVAGNGTTADMLAKMTGLAPGAVDRSLDQASLARLVEPASGVAGSGRGGDLPPRARSGARTYSFHHELVRQAFYQRVPDAELRRLHGLAAELLAAGGSHAELAHHLILAGRSAEAPPVLELAAAEAGSRGAYRQAAELYEQALHFARSSEVSPHEAGDAPASRRQRGNLLLVAGMSWVYEGEPQQASERLTEAVSELRAAGDVDGEGAAHAFLGRSLWEQGYRPDATEQYQLARELLEHKGPSAPLAFATVRLARLHLDRGDFETGEALAREALVIADAIDATGIRSLALNALGWSRANRGDTEGSLRLLDESYEVARADGLSYEAGVALANGIAVRVYNMKARECDPLIERLGALAAAGGRDFDVAFRQGQVDFRLGRLHDGARRLRTALEVARAGGTVIFEQWAARALADVELALGHLDSASELLAVNVDIEDASALDDGAHPLLWWHLASRSGRAAITADTILAVAPRLRDTFEMYPLLAEAWTETGEPAGIEKAAALVAAVDGSEPGRTDAYVAWSGGLISLARGDPRTAVAQLRFGLGGFRRAGYRLHAACCRLALTDALAVTGDTPAAAGELARVLATARSTGAGLVEAQARALQRRWHLELQAL
jgi:DNA-binding SARP family transcriptional activator/tetratricopeptide (TPR) repeat protein